MGSAARSPATNSLQFPVIFCYRGYHRIVRNAAEQLGTICERFEMLPPGMSASVKAVACGFGDDPDE
jgi:hypothetical protein